MVNRKLTMFETTGTKIKNKKTGTKGYIAGVSLGGYAIHCITYNVDKFLPYSDIGDYVVTK